MFEGIGTMNSYLQMKQLRFAANYRLATGQDLNAQRKASKSLVESMLAASKTEAAQTADQAEALRTALIKQELMNGKELSDEEMRYLKEKAPDLYAKAQKAQKAREELKEELQQLASIRVRSVWQIALGLLCKKYSCMRMCCNGYGRKRLDFYKRVSPGSNSLAAMVGSCWSRE